MSKTIRSLSDTASERSAENLSGSCTTAVKAYETPVLISYGDVRDITLGPTIGGGESGCAAVFRNGPGGCPSP